MKEQTAVEWFENQVGHNSLMGLKEFNEIFEKAKEMEKEQVIEAFKTGTKMVDVDNEIDALFNAIMYYNETFKQQEL
jgi:hypothetical protein